MEHTLEVCREVQPPNVMSTASVSITDAGHYADLRDRWLAATLLAEDEAEELGLDPLERISCRTHRRWLHQCISSPVHIIVVTGHRWCRSCAAEASVAVDELTGDVRVRCTRCGLPPAGRATRQIIRTCTASLATALDTKTSGYSAEEPPAADPVAARDRNQANGSSVTP